MILRAISIQYKLRFLEMHINKLALSYCCNWLIARAGKESGQFTIE
jgi:hypothetical protein